MPRPQWADPVERAFFDAWIDDAEMPDEMRNQRRKAFQRRWGALKEDAFQRALQEGNEEDRLCALFALGYLAPAGSTDLLIPFLSSPVRKERWASAIALGESRDERALPFLQTCLLEQMEYQPSQYEKEGERIRMDTSEMAQGSTVSLFWERMNDSAFARMGEENQQGRSVYQWHMIHRFTITTLLGIWGDSRAIPALRLAFQRCWEMEQRGEIPGSSWGLWHALEDDLAYALGQLKAWNALDGLAMPPARFKLARMYLVFGSLEVNLRDIYSGNIMRLIESGTVDQDAVIRALREHFGVDDALARANLTVFQQWYGERAAISLPGRMKRFKR